MITSIMCVVDDPIQALRKALLSDDDYKYYHHQLLISILTSDHFNRLASSSNFSLALEELDRQVFSWVTYLVLGQ